MKKAGSGKTPEKSGNEQQAKKMQEFKKLLLELSAKLIIVPIDEIGQEIDRAFTLIGTFWDFDRIILTEVSEDGPDEEITHAYYAPGVSKPSPRANDNVPWIMSKVRQGHTVTLAHAPEDLPEDARIDRAYYVKEHIKSAVAMPFKIGKRILGGLFFTTIHRQFVWSDELLGEFHYLGEVFASVLGRQRAAKRIDELIRFEQVLSEISAKYVNLPRLEVEKHIRDDLGRLGEFLGTDCCVFNLMDKRKGNVENAVPFIWWAKEGTNFTGNIADEGKESKEPSREDFIYGIEKWSRGESLKWSYLDELPPEAEAMKRACMMLGIKSYLSIPISIGGTTIGVLVIATLISHRSWPQDFIPRIRLFGEVIGNALMRKKNEENLHAALTEVKELKERIESDYLYLSDEVNTEHEFGEIVGKSSALKDILVKVTQVAPTDATVLLLGETGTGKGLIARLIHNKSKRCDRPLVQVNCAALTPSLIESELFGHERGAFTGAGEKRAGRFEIANGSTLFLDEIGELPLELQAKLLRVLQDGEFERVGGSKTIRTDVRVVAATNKDLQKEAEEKRFRQDLWYRLSVFPVFVPPLRERADDIPLFVRHFVDKYEKWIGKRFDMIPQNVIKALQEYYWPGNIRELENLIERAVITSPDGNLRVELPTVYEGSSATDGKSLLDLERDYILATLENSYWRIEGPTGAAQRLDMNPSTLRFRMRKLGIVRPSSRQ